MNVLGVTTTNRLGINEHIDNLVSSASQSLYALKTLKSHGLPMNELSTVCRSTLVSRLVYASQAWHGYTTSSDINRLNSVISRAKRWNIYANNAPSIEDIINQADQSLFESVLNNDKHVLHYLLPPIKVHNYNMRARAHNRLLPVNSTPAVRNFVQRMLFTSTY